MPEPTKLSSRQELAQELLNELISTQLALDFKEKQKAIAEGRSQDVIGESFMLHGLKNLKELLTQ